MGPPVQPRRLRDRRRADDTRGYYGSSLPAQGGIEERFTQLTWYRRDICDRARFPFGDKSIDFVTCSHVLEDVRDPLWVCSEMIRVSKRGYIEVPSRVAESCRGVEPDQVGWSHHRWLVDLQSGAISFLNEVPHDSQLQTLLVSRELWPPAGAGRN